MERLRRLVEDLREKSEAFQKLSVECSREVTMGELQVRFEFPGELTAAEVGELERAVREYSTDEWAPAARVFSGSGWTVIEMRPPELVSDDLSSLTCVTVDDVVARACVRPREWRITQWHIKRLLDAFAYTGTPRVFVMDLRELNTTQTKQFFAGIRQLVAQLIGGTEKEAEGQMETWYDSGVAELLKWFAEAFNSGMLDGGGW